MANPQHRRAFSFAWICLGITIFLLIPSLPVSNHLQNVHFLIRALMPIYKLDWVLQDHIAFLGKKILTDPHIVYLKIDKDSMILDSVFDDELATSPTLQLMKKGWPWSRLVYAHILERLANAGARVVVFDLLFDSPKPGDSEFRVALDRFHDRVVVGFNFTENDYRLSATAPTFSQPTANLIPQTKPMDDRAAYVNYDPDTDGVIRRTRFRRPLDDTHFNPQAELYYSVANRTITKFGHPELIPPGTQHYRFPCAGIANSFPSHSVYEIFVPSLWENNYGRGTAFRNKIVVVGPYGNQFHDEHQTQMGVMPGAELHCNVINAVLQHVFLTEPSPAQQYGTMILAGLLAWGLSIGIRQPLRRFGAILLLNFGLVLYALVLFNGWNHVIILAAPLLILDAGWLTCFIYEFVLERREKARIRSTLERYVSKNIVHELVDNPQSFLNAQHGQRKPVTILFSDVRGFTSMTENADPIALVAQLNEYMEAMVRDVFAEEGTLDKFIGDAVMAVWGNIVSRGPAEDIKASVRCALRMRESLKNLNQNWRARNIQELAFGIGINHGDAVVGNIGSHEKMEVTVIGDAVNTASRLESLTKAYHIDILIGESVAQRIRNDFHLQTVDYVRVVGKTKPLVVYGVWGPTNHPFPSQEQAFLENYEKGFTAYLQREFTHSAACFRQCLDILPGNPLAEIHFKRCQEYLQNPPDPQWDGVHIMTKK